MTSLRERQEISRCQALVRSAPDLAGVQRIDIGCGAPEERCDDCFGLDLNPRYDPDLVWDCDLGLPFADESLSFINSDNSFEHFRHPFFVLEECYRCLRPGGRMRLVVPNVQYFPTLLLALVWDIDRYFTWYMSLPHKRQRTIHQSLFTPHTLKRMAIEAGFEVLRTRGFLYSKEAALELAKGAGR